MRCSVLNKWFKGDPGKDGSNFFRTKARVVSEIE